MKYVAVIDGTVGGAEAQAHTLAGFLHEGLRRASGVGAEENLAGATHGLDGETVVFYADHGDRDRLVGLAPTPAVRLVRAPARRPDQLAAALVAAVRDGGFGLFLFAGGPGGAEAATRLARRAGGSVLTGVLDAVAGPERLVARRRVYSNHMTGSFALAARPWCVAVDPSLAEAHVPSCAGHSVLSDVTLPNAGPSPFSDLVHEAPPATSDLATARVVVVAGSGAGGRDRVARIAAAARRMGAAFGVTRPVAMNGWAPTDRLIGVSGARVAPSLALVAGASGAPAFLWGIERADVIVAVNTDEQAPIVKGSDAVVIADGVALVEALADLVDPGDRG